MPVPPPCCCNVGTWKTTLRAWMQGGALLPIQAVYDLVGNLFNLQVGCPPAETRLERTDWEAIGMERRKKQRSTGQPHHCHRCPRT